ncbi:snake venom 5'-nucleotidase-like [Schistocerca cancellata]|uniref:snake venom 5'-nucleotidase-like n=1 Tax=Schistocerca cancellata TaxID=274614 RepID=UPI002119A9AF|nr:snake venom 5'-nucleotidase-like [Schistocerca cancellata]
MCTFVNITTGTLLFIVLAVLLGICAGQTDNGTLRVESARDTGATDTTVESTSETTTTDSTTSDTTTVDSTVSDPTTASGTSGSTPRSENTLLIHFISDLQYNILPVDSEMDLCQVTTGVISEDCFGGYGRLATYMRDKKVDTDIWLNAGNMLQGSLFSILKFDPIVEAMNSLQFDAVAAEPGMFRYGTDAAEQIYKEGLKDVLVPFNYKEQSTKQIQKSECKIAFVGFIDKEKADAMGVNDVTLQDEMEYIKKEVAALVTGDNDIIILMGTTSKGKALEMANIEGVDLVIYSGAEAADFSPDSNYLWNDTQKSNGEKVYIASLKIDATKPESFFTVGEISLTVTDDCTVSDAIFNNVSDYGQANISDSFYDQTVALLEGMQTAVAKTSVPLTGADNVCQLGECLLGNLVADAVMSAVSTAEEIPVIFSVFPTWTLFTNVSLTGNISVADIYGIFENDSYIYSVTLNGQQLKEMFEEAVSDYRSPSEPMKNFLQVSSYLHATYNLENKAGERVKQIQIFNISDPRGFNTVNLNDATISYNVALPKFVLEGNHFSFVKSESLNPKFYKFTFLDSLTDYISWKGSLQSSAIPVIPTVGERIKFYKGTNNSGETCYNNTGEVVIITLVIIVVIAGAGFAGWKFLYPKYRARRGSRIALIM